MFSKSLLMNKGMNSISIACLLMHPLALDFNPNIHNFLLVNDKSLAGGPRFALQFNDITKDLSFFNPTCFVILSKLIVSPSQDELQLQA